MVIDRSSPGILFRINPRWVSGSPGFASYSLLDRRDTGRSSDLSPNQTSRFRRRESAEVLSVRIDRSGSCTEHNTGCESFALRRHGLLVSAPKKRYSKRTQLSFGISSRNNRIVVHDVSSRFFVRRFENCNPCIDPTECRTGKDQDTIAKELLKPQKVVVPDLLLLIGDRCGEVVARWMQEIDPFRHTDRFAQP